MVCPASAFDTYICWFRRHCAHDNGNAAVWMVIGACSCKADDIGIIKVICLLAIGKQITDLDQCRSNT